MHLRRIGTCLRTMTADLYGLLARFPPTRVQWKPWPSVPCQIAPSFCIPETRWASSGYGTCPEIPRRIDGRLHCKRS